MGSTIFILHHLGLFAEKRQWNLISLSNIKYLIRFVCVWIQKAFCMSAHILYFCILMVNQKKVMVFNTACIINSHLMKLFPTYYFDFCLQIFELKHVCVIIHLVWNWRKYDIIKEKYGVKNMRTTHFDCTQRIKHKSKW